jgi:hypothetical protein
MFVTVTLNSGHGISLGPRFYLSCNVGTPKPSFATLSELLAGKVIEVLDSATEIQVTSNGACTNAITFSIGSVPTTTTTTTTTSTTTTTTTTTAAPTTTTTTTTTTAAPETTTTTTSAPIELTTTTTTTTTTAAPECTYDGLSIVCDATTTTTTAAPTTTTAAPTYNFVRCDVYSCNFAGDLLNSNVIVRIPTGTPTPSIFSSLRWYFATPFDNKAYYLTSTSVSGPSYAATLVNDPQLSRSSACFEGSRAPTTTTTSTTTTTTTTTGAPSYPTVSDCGGSANLAIVNNATGISVGYTVPTDGISDMAVCTINGSPLSTGQSDSFIGAFNSSTYTELTGAGGKQLRTWVGGTIFSTTSITSSPLTVYGDFGYFGSFVILEIIN